MDPGLAYNIAHDTEYIIQLRADRDVGSSKTIRLCDSLYQLLQQRGVAGQVLSAEDMPLARQCKQPMTKGGGANLAGSTQVCYHALEEMRQDGEVLAYRHNVVNTQEITFVPDAINVDERMAAGRSLSYGEIGALYRGHFDRLPRTLCTVAWEHKSLPGHALQPTRPRLLLMADLVVPAGQALRLG
jgi:hypothetical protein